MGVAGSWWHLVAVLVSIVGSLIMLLVLYWIIRLAVRHGIEDAWRRRAQRSAEEAGWDPARR